MNTGIVPARSDAEKLKRLNHAMGPVMAGMIIDAVDLITFGPIGLIVGLPLGAVAGYWLGQSMGLTQKGCLTCAAAAGVYCAIPFTELLPLGTLVGALARYQDFGAEPAEPTTEPAEQQHGKGGRLGDHSSERAGE